MLHLNLIGTSGQEIKIHQTVQQNVRKNDNGQNSFFGNPMIKPGRATTRVSVHMTLHLELDHTSFWTLDLPHVSTCCKLHRNSLALIMFLVSRQVSRQTRHGNIILRAWALKANTPHLEPTRTGQPACLVSMSPSPDFFKFHQKAASPYRKREDKNTINVWRLWTAVTDFERLDASSDYGKYCGTTQLHIWQLRWTDNWYVEQDKDRVHSRKKEQWQYGFCLYHQWKKLRRCQSHSVVHNALLSHSLPPVV